MTENVNPIVPAVAPDGTTKPVTAPNPANTTNSQNVAGPSKPVVPVPPAPQKPQVAQPPAVQPVTNPPATTVMLPKDDVYFAGRVGMPFSIRGKGFGNSGQLTIGGTPVVASRWTDTSIKGVVPAHLASGDTTVAINGKTIKAKI